MIVMSTSKRLRSPAAQGFTLAEMLVVLAIMAILAVLAAQSVGALRSEKLTTAGNQMVDVFAMARQNSISNNDFTAVVVQTTGTRACAAYSLWELARQTDGTLATAWTQVTVWKFLPKGVVFESGTSLDTFMASTVSSTVFPFSSVAPTYTFLGTQISSVAVQCYQPDGTLIGEQSLQLRLVEGTADPGTGNTTYQGTTVSGTQVSYYDIFFIGNTGTTKIGRS
jgi:prepilin-type N-terminal cleavage/methylation domain-containing protein